MALRLTAAIMLVMETLVGGKLSEYRVESKLLTKDMLFGWIVS